MTGSVGAAGAPVIEARGLTKLYGDSTARTVVLQGVDFTVQPGEVVALLGPSGSGKSTLLNILGCLDRPSSGTYFLGGYDVSGLGREAQAWVRLHYIGFVFQSFHLVAHATAVENVAMPLYYAGIRRAERTRRALALLERVGLSHRALHRPSQLSGGERQRTAIARALACGPRLLLADEPTGALDSRAGADVLRLLTDLRARDNLTLLMVTHDPVVARAADRRVFLLDGRVSELPSNEARDVR